MIHTADSAHSLVDVIDVSPEDSKLGEKTTDLAHNQSIAPASSSIVLHSTCYEEKTINLRHYSVACKTCSEAVSHAWDALLMPLRLAPVNCVHYYISLSASRCPVQQSKRPTWLDNLWEQDIVRPQVMAGLENQHLSDGKLHNTS